MEELMSCLDHRGHLASAGARTHSYNTAEMTAMIEALAFLGPRVPVAREEQSCFYCGSLHAAGICLGTIQARTHVQLGLACQRSMIFAQRKLRLTMQHVYGHSGNLGNECADHPAALVTLNFTSNHNVATCWIHHNFASACFDGCNNITEIPERLQRIRTDAASLSKKLELALCSPSSYVHFWSFVIFRSQFFLLSYCFLDQVMDSLSSSGSTVPGFDDHFAHNMWNPLLELLFLEQVSGIFASFVVEIDLAKIALSCHFALGLLCYKVGAFDSA